MLCRYNIIMFDHVGKIYRRSHYFFWGKKKIKHKMQKCESMKCKNFLKYKC